MSIGPWTSFLCVSSPKCVYMCVRRCPSQTPNVFICVSPNAFICVSPNAFICVSPNAFICVSPNAFTCVSTKCVHMCVKLQMRLNVCHRVSEGKKRAKFAVRRRVVGGGLSIGGGFTGGGVQRKGPSAMGCRVPGFGFSSGFSGRKQKQNKNKMKREMSKSKKK